MEVLEERFADWGLTPAERDVALFAIKGMSTQEIATLRSTSEGTVKAQTNAIYRKAGVSGRGGFSLFIEDLMEQDAPKPETQAQRLALDRRVPHVERHDLDRAAVGRGDMDAGRAPSSAACRKRAAQRHQRSPGLRPGEDKSGRGVERSLPTYLE